MCKAVLIVLMMSADPSAWGPGVADVRFAMPSLEACHDAIKSGAFPTEKGVGATAICVPVASADDADTACGSFCTCTLVAAP